MKKTIFVLAIIAALAIALYKWLTNGENEETMQETTTEEMKEPANNEKENVKDQTERAKAEDKVNENHKLKLLWKTTDTIWKSKMLLSSRNPKRDNALLFWTTQLKLTCRVRR